MCAQGLCIGKTTLYIQRIYSTINLIFFFIFCCLYKCKDVVWKTIFGISLVGHGYKLVIGASFRLIYQLQALWNSVGHYYKGSVILTLFPYSPPFITLVFCFSIPFLTEKCSLPPLSLIFLIPFVHSIHRVSLSVSLQLGFNFISLNSHIQQWNPQRIVLSLFYWPRLVFFP